MNELVLVVVNEESHHIIDATSEPVFGLVRCLAVCSDRDSMLAGDGAKNLRAALNIAADFLVATERIPRDGWLQQLVERRTWLTKPCTPRLTSVRHRRTSIVLILRSLAEHMSASRVVDKLRLEPDDLYCALHFAADVLHHLPGDLAREAKEKAERAYWMKVERRFAKLRSPPINVRTRGLA